MTDLFIWILRLHVSCVIASGSLFAARGTMHLVDARMAHRPALRYLSYGIDTTLLAAGVALAVIVHQAPFVQAWLTVKLLAVLAYIGLGIQALRCSRTRRARAGFLFAALAMYGFVVSVALTRSPWGVFTLLQG